MTHAPETGTINRLDWR